MNICYNIYKLTGGNMKKLKIGLFIDTYFPMVDGVVIAVHNYALHLSKYADVTVFAPLPRDKDYHVDLPYRVVRCKRMLVPFTDYDLGTPALDRKYHRYLKKVDLDLVHIHSPFEVGKTGVKYANKHHIPAIASLHSQLKKDFLERTKSKVIAHIATKQIMQTLNKANYFWAVNHKVADIFKSYGLKEQPNVHFNGTDLVFNQDMNAVNQLRADIKKRDEDRILLFVGRLDFIKNLDFLIHALEVLDQKKCAYQMVFVGSGPHRKALEKMVEKAGIENRVRFEGRIMDRERLAQYYQAADLFVFPSKYDSSSLVQIEAASQKTPSIFLEDTATADTVTADHNGYIAKDDVNAFADKIIAIFKDEKQYQIVCENAYKDLFHTWEEVVKLAYDKYVQILDQWESQ